MVCALGSAVCFGIASVFQAVAARAAEAGSGSGLDTRLLMRALAQWRYVAGLGLDTVGFVLELVALRRLPIYAVGAALAGSLAVTAVAASRMLRVRLSGAEWGAVAAVCGGLASLVLASGAEGDRPGDTALRVGTLCAAVAVLGVAVSSVAPPAVAVIVDLGLQALFFYWFLMTTRLALGTNWLIAAALMVVNWVPSILLSFLVDRYLGVSLGVAAGG